MDQVGDGAALYGDTVHCGLKHFPPGCFVSVKLETSEEGVCEESKPVCGANLPKDLSSANFIPAVTDISSVEVSLHKCVSGSHIMLQKLNTFYRIVIFFNRYHSI